VRSFNDYFGAAPCTVNFEVCQYSFGSCEITKFDFIYLWFTDRPMCFLAYRTATK